VSVSEVLVIEVVTDSDGVNMPAWAFTSLRHRGTPLTPSVIRGLARAMTVVRRMRAALVALLFVNGIVVGGQSAFAQKMDAEKLRRLNALFDAPITSTKLLKRSIAAQLQKCWSVTKGARALVKVSIRYRQDGSLDGEPVVIQPKPDPSFQEAAATAIAAVKACSPMKLPVEQYQHWKSIEWQFDAPGRP